MRKRPENLKRREVGTHHVMNTARIHRQYEAGEYIRNAILAKEMWRVSHEDLHRNTAQVPLLGCHALQVIASGLDPAYDDVFEGIDDFSRLVDKVGKDPRARPGERELGEVTVGIVRSQIPYIREGIPNGGATIL